MPLGAPHEGIAASLDRLQGGAADRVTAPVVPVARRVNAAEDAVCPRRDQDNDTDHLVRG